MSENCPLCCQELNGVTFYVRWYDGRFYQCLTRDIQLPIQKFRGPHRSAVTVNGTFMKIVDIVNMTTGKVFRKDCKRALPDWLEDPTKRAIIAANGDLPLIYKNSKVEKASRSQKIAP